jgi:multicomponent Na+:H+ antiporter subunit D
VTALVPLVLALPFLGAAALAAAGHFLPSRVDNVAAAGIACAVTVLSTLLIFRSAQRAIEYWFGGWHPRHGIAIGVAFHVEPLGASIAAVAGTLMTAALLFTLNYFEDAAPQHFYVLMLVFLGALEGFALSGDLFNMFVFFELMSICAFGLTAYRIERRRVLQGAINFGVTNTIAALMILMGIALLYGRTGALNLSQIGEALRGRHPDGLVVVSFVLIACGFLIKAGAFPFHFWLGDAYAVAPAPVCVLFAGIMSDLALHGLARVYWNAYAGALGHGDVRAVLLAVGIATVCVGGLMCTVQASLKRMLAFVTISQIGVGLIGIALLSPRGLAGSTVYIVADGLVRGALFLAAGQIAFTLGSVDELRLRGAGRRAPLAGLLLLAGGIGLAVIPPLGTFAGWGLISQAASGRAWLEPFLIAATVLPAAAVLRAFARIFLGLGPKDDPLLIRTVGTGGDEQAEDRGRKAGLVMLLPGVALLVSGLGLAFAPGLVDEAVVHAQAFVRPHAVALEALHGVQAAAPAVPHVHLGSATVAYGALSVLLAMLVGALSLYREGLPERLRRGAGVLQPLFGALRSVHDGVTGEYVAWLTFGTAAIGGALSLLIR